MTTVQASLLANMMPAEAATVLTKFGVTDMDGIAGRTIDYLKEFKLIEHTENLLTGKMIWILTRDGAKVRKQLGRAE